MKLFLTQILYLLGEDKKKLPFLVIIFLLASILDLIGIGLMGPYIALLVDVDVFLGTTGKVINFIGLPQEKKPLLIIMGYTLLAVFTVKAFFSIWINKVVVEFSEDQHVRLKTFLMSSYQYFCLLGITPLTPPRGSSISPLYLGMIWMCICMTV